MKRLWPRSRMSRRSCESRRPRRWAGLATTRTRQQSLKVLLHYARPEENAFLSLAAWNALDYLDERAAPAEQALLDLSPDPSDLPQRYGGYGLRLKQKTLLDLQ